MYMMIYHYIYIHPLYDDSDDFRSGMDVYHISCNLTMAAMAHLLAPPCSALAPWKMANLWPCPSSRHHTCQAQSTLGADPGPHIAGGWTWMDWMPWNSSKRMLPSGKLSHSYWSHGPVEIVSFPMKKMVIFPEGNSMEFLWGFSGNHTCQTLGRSDAQPRNLHLVWGFSSQPRLICQRL